MRGEYDDYDDDYVSFLDYLKQSRVVLWIQRIFRPPVSKTSQIGSIYTDQIALRIVNQLKNQMAVASTLNMRFEEGHESKIGDTVRVRLPIGKAAERKEAEEIE